MNFRETFMCFGHPALAVLLMSRLPSSACIPSVTGVPTVLCVFTISLVPSGLQSVAFLLILSSLHCFAVVPDVAGTTILFDVPDRQATQAVGIDSLESIPGLFKR